MKKEINCKICGSGFMVYPYRESTAIFCSRKCKSIHIGVIRREKAKPRISSQGYYFIKMPGYHRANKQGYAKVADIVAEKHFNIILNKNQIVHHKDKDRLNDSPENLEILSKIDHDIIHLTEGLAFRVIKSKNKKCSYANCLRKHEAKGFCKMHYKREKRRHNFKQDQC